ncbi:glycine cleavage system protein GcvH [Rhodothermus marinus]|uniref:glycine cleavage system protein GcvH n=1 Tax=Rhodothermus marinus TaxID=29549 RepID=UPI000223DD13|nr:glycine cleavage system protein GcvH [Rhodothermus marinus]AEN74106.1 Glycine cleavage system H protein [Rhodothermus marinus SG0.5JP17-172]MBO2490918.1 glycine cleavage system protein GcvH [Rhodothermus marinus]BBM68858.1 glycine cleavage system H protein [Rhodothermus marinus]BBM71838.1 glycine cleavage system H protein [Rhodothermus marinus]
MEFPSELRYTKEHEWLRLEADGKEATVGITDFAQRELGDIVYVELQPVGTELAKDEVFGTVEAVKTVSELFMPVSGTIIAVNEALQDHPELVNQSPYGEGWMIRIAVKDPSEVETLLTAEEYAAMVG